MKKISIQINITVQIPALQGNNQSVLFILIFTGPDENVLSSLRQPDYDVIGMMTVCPNVLERHIYT